jgi:hypothetical protein
MKLSTIQLLATLGLALATGSVSPIAWAQDDSAVDETTRQIIDELIAQRRGGAAVFPTGRPDVQHQPNRVGVPAAAVDLDPSVVGVLPGDPLPRLRREGEFVIERPGRLIPIEELNAWVFAFEPVPGEPDLRPMIVQRCQRLASMQDTLDQQRDGEAEMVFTLTGQVHTYRGVNYLLPTAIAGTRQLGRESIPAAADAADAADPGTPADEAYTGPVRNAETPATFGGPGTPGSGPDPIDLMEQMLDQRPPSPRRPDSAPLSTQQDAELDAALRGLQPDPQRKKPLRREGEYLIDRRGRLTRGLSGLIGGEAQNVMFAFEADGNDPEAGDPPMMLMPCKLLEAMEDLIAERGDAVVFKVSGRVHTYRGANYLLPTTMRVAVGSDNLGG